MFSAWLLVPTTAVLILTGHHQLSLIAAGAVVACSCLQVLAANRPPLPLPFRQRAVTLAIVSSSIAIGLAGLVGELYALGAGVAALVAWTAAIRRRLHVVQDARADWVEQMAGAVQEQFKPKVSEPPAQKWVHVLEWRSKPPPPLPSFPTPRQWWRHFKASAVASRPIYPARLWIEVPPRVRGHLIRQAFMEHLDVVTGMRWDYEWRLPKRAVYLTPQRPLPVPVWRKGRPPKGLVRLPRDYDHTAEWWLFPVGINSRRQIIYWDVSIHPHARLAGTTRLGKTALLRLLLLHASASGRWKMYLCDPKKFELRFFRNRPGVQVLATDVESIRDAIKEVYDEMMRRVDLVGDVLAPDGSVIDVPPEEVVAREGGILLVIDETSAFFTLKKLKDKGDADAEDELRKEALNYLLDIGRLGAAVGVHCLLAQQRPNHEVFPGDLKNNVEGGGALHVDTAESSRMAIGTRQAYELPKVKGRVLWRLEDGTFEETQAFWADKNDLDELVPVPSLAYEEPPFDSEAGLEEFVEVGPDGLESGEDPAGDGAIPLTLLTNDPDRPPAAFRRRRPRPPDFRHNN
jgi:FtsK/SpoIIIE family